MEKAVSKEKDPVEKRSKTAAASRAASPTLLTRRAFRAAKLALNLVCQKLTRR